MTANVLRAPCNIPTSPQTQIGSLLDHRWVRKTDQQLHLRGDCCNYIGGGRGFCWGISLRCKQALCWQNFRNEIELTKLLHKSHKTKCYAAFYKILVYPFVYIECLEGVAGIGWENLELLTGKIESSACFLNKLLLTVGRKFHQPPCGFRI